jgi:hypothetical protein
MASLQASALIPSASSSSLSSLSSSRSSTSLATKNVLGKVGSYAISTIDFDTWANEPSNASSKMRKPRGVKEIVNPIFAECAKVTTDPFWIEKFTQASIGKFPRKFTFHDGVLTYRKGAKTNSVELSSDAFQATQTSLEFFRAHGGIFSTIDQDNSNNVQTTGTFQETIQPVTWKSASKKDRDVLISYFLIAMKKIMNLSDSEVDQLDVTIKVGVFDKYFGDHNITITNNQVYSIGGLLWDEAKRKFYIDPNLTPVSSRTYSRKKEEENPVEKKQKDMIPTFLADWDDYVEFLDKKLASYNHKIRKVVINNPNKGKPRLLSLSTGTTLTDISTGTQDDDVEDEDEEMEDDLGSRQE